VKKLKTILRHTGGGEPEIFEDWKTQTLGNAKVTKERTTRKKDLKKNKVNFGGVEHCWGKRVHGEYIRLKGLGGGGKRKTGTKKGNET